jgi:hypothetical protein
MKTLKIIMLLIAFSIIFPINTIAQKKQMYVVHEDQVKPAMEAEYLKISKELIDACVKYNLQNSDWHTVRVDNGSYLYLSTIKNMAELDVNNFAPLADKMGKEKLSDIFKRFNNCYDKHGNYILTLHEDLSYMPEGITIATEGQNFRKFHYFYVTPQNSAKVADKMKEIKELFASKKSKEYYRIYNSGFGVMGEYYLVAISAKDEQSYEKTSNETNALLGEEWNKKFNELFILTERYEQKSGYMHPELGYISKK